MCGRYFFDLADIDPKQLAEYEAMAEQGYLRPSSGGLMENAPGMRMKVFCAQDGKIVPREMQWGFPSLPGQAGPINARCETALQKPMFSEAALYRRCVIKARGGFFEWKRKDPMRPRYRVRLRSAEDMYMAGLYTPVDPALGCPRYVILTQDANDAVRPIHDRMPLILEGRDMIREWLLNQSAALKLLASPPAVELIVETDDPEQTTLF